MARDETIRRLNEMAQSPEVELADNADALGSVMTQVSKRLAHENDAPRAAGPADNCRTGGHLDDLFGRIIPRDHEGTEKWTIVKIPAESLGADVDPLGRPAGPNVVV